MKRNRLSRPIRTGAIFLFFVTVEPLPTSLRFLG
jgi:hypothetical protein